MFNKVLAFLKRNILAAGTTPFGKAIEHGAVAAASVGLSLLTVDLAKGDLSLTALSAVALAVGTTFLAAVRAALKQLAQGL